MELSELQKRVDTWIREYGVRYFSELIMTAPKSALLSKKTKCSPAKFEQGLAPPFIAFLFDNQKYFETVR